MGDLSRNFSRAELACKHCGGLILNFDLLDALQELRNLAGRPIIVTSGYRCPDHPESRKRPASHHVLGQAADVVISRRSLREAYNLARKVPAFAKGGIGVYPDPEDLFLHLDVRKDGPNRWMRIDGEYTALNPALLENL